jgi:hypothetical protein
MTNTKRAILIVISLPIIYLMGKGYYVFFPPTVEYISGQHEDFVLGENKIDLITRLKDTNHGFTPLPLDPDRDRNWVIMDSITEKEHKLLLKSDKWRAGNFGHSDECRCPHTMMYFNSGKLSKIRVECRACK